MPIEQTVKHRPEDDDTVLSFLGDVIIASGFPNQQFSIGDIVIALGILDLCFEGSRVPRRRDSARRGADSAGLIVEQASPVEHDLEGRQHAGVVEVLRRRAQCFECETGPFGVPVRELVERARDLEDLARNDRRTRRDGLAVRQPLRGDDVACGSEQLGPPQDAGTRLRNRHRLGRTAVVGFVETDLAKVVEQRGGLELARVRNARIRVRHRSPR